MTRARADAGFTLPEVLVALLIISGVMIAAVDALRAFEDARTRSRDAHRILTEERIAEGIASRATLKASDEAFQARVQLSDALAAAPGSDLPDLEPIVAGGQISAWVLNPERPIATVPVRIDAPTPCVFDAVARECRQ